MIQSNTALQIESVTVSYDGNTILKNLNLEVQRGDFVALLGPSGSGKSTLLRAVMKEVALSSGSIRGPKRIAFAPQRSPLLPWLTVLENVELARPAGTPESIFRKRALDALDRAGLKDHLSLSSHKLSGGMRSRASLIRAFLMLEPNAEAPVILLDEPFIGLDVVKRDLLHKLTQELWTETRPATIFVTHDLQEAFKLANRIVVLSKEGNSFPFDQRGQPWKEESRLLSEVYEALR